MKKTIYWIIDYFYLFVGKLVMHVYRNPPKHYLNYVIEGKNPIILIPGIANRWGFLKKLGDSISLRGHPVHVVRELNLNLFDIPASAKIVRKIIDENNLKKIIIIGHSKGGLIGKYLLIHNNIDNRIIGLITIGAPFSGSILAKNSPRKSSKDLIPESAMLRTLSSHKEVNVKIISIMPAFDNHVWHRKGSYLEGATNITVLTKGHHKIVFDETAINKVIESIEKFK